MKIQNSIIRYLVIDYIGEGGFCFVWLCYRFRDNTFWALKLFHKGENYSARRERKIMEKIGKITMLLRLQDLKT